MKAKNGPANKPSIHEKKNNNLPKNKESMKQPMIPQTNIHPWRKEQIIYQNRY